MSTSIFNRAGRRSGGERPFKIASLFGNDPKLLAQETLVRAKYGEEGVKAFWAELERIAEKESIHAVSEDV